MPVNSPRSIRMAARFFRANSLRNARLQERKTTRDARDLDETIWSFVGRHISGYKKQQSFECGLLGFECAEQGN